MHVFSHPCTWFLRATVVIFPLFFLLTQASHLLSPIPSSSVASMHRYAHIGTKEQAPIMHSLKACNLAAIAFSGGTQKNQCWETTAPGLSSERSLGGKIVRVCPEQSQEHPWDGSINFCSYQTLTIKKGNGNQGSTFVNVAPATDVAFC